MNTDQGSQFTGSAWIRELTKEGVRISMDGRGRYLDNIFIERLWRSLKQEAIYLEERSATASRLARSSRIGWRSTIPSDPTPHLIGAHRTRHTGKAWKSKKQHET